MTTTIEVPKTEGRELLSAKVEAIVDDLAELTTDDIAEAVQALIGTKRAEYGNPHSCAIALYLIQQAGLPETVSLSVGGYEVNLYDEVTGKAWSAAQDRGEMTDLLRDYGFGTVSLPDNVRDFITAFDLGNYPDLATEESLAQIGTGDDPSYLI